jgi:L-asparaginase
MSLGKRPTCARLEAQLLREGIVESVHLVDAVVSDQRGRTLIAAGNPESAFFIRSALKPFQALAATSCGTLARYGLEDRDLAIICSSHQGAIEQARQAFNILWHCDIDISALQCPWPSGASSRLQHNCSGKHAGMLAVCKQQGWPLESYMRREHPVQQLIIGKIAELLAMPPDEFIAARDDCGVPTYYMELQQMATLYARLASGQSLELERIIRAMTRYPELIAGEAEFDTVLMRLTQGQLVSKGGAEGIQCIGRVSEGLGLAIKARDGAKRAKQAVAIHLLRQVGWITPEIAEILEAQFMDLGNGRRLEVIGDLTLV